MPSQPLQFPQPILDQPQERTNLSQLTMKHEMNNFEEMPSPSSSVYSSQTMSLNGDETEDQGKSGELLLGMTDQELAKLSVRQLNQKLQGQDRQIISLVKQKRRTLKNRGYALNCRVRRIRNQIQLEADNVLLRERLKQLEWVVKELKERVSYYEQKDLAIVSQNGLATGWPTGFMQ